MVARIIHFGFDDCYRVRVLQAAGYDVRESRSLIEFRTHLQREEGVAAVVVSDQEQAEEAATLAENTAPVILFRRGTREIDARKFDCIFESTDSPEVWLSELAEAIARSRMLQEEAQRLCIEAAAVRAESRRQQTRARMLRGMNPRKKLREQS